MKTGVYIITNKVTNHIYIGSTTKSFSHRWGIHRLDLRRKKHHNSYLQNAWNKYGENNFKFEILELCDKSICIEREQFWMDTKMCYQRDIGYNLNKKAQSRLGTKMDPSKIFYKYKNIHAYKIDGSYIGVYSNITTASTHLKIDSKLITAVLVKSKKSTKGLVFSLIKEFPGYYIDISNKSHPHSNETKQKMSKTRTGLRITSLHKPVIQLEGDIPVKEFICITDAAKELNIKSSNISAVLNGHRPTAGGYKWLYKTADTK